MSTIYTKYKREKLARNFDSMYETYNPLEKLSPHEINEYLNKFGLKQKSTLASINKNS